MTLMLHITTREAWQRALADGAYRGDTLATEGFIHCSTPAQVVRVANARFRGAADLVLLCIDAERVQPEVRYEDWGDGEFFPHIYGALNADAVVQVVDFPAMADGTFALPAEITAGN